MCKVVIKISQGSVLTQTVLSERCILIRYIFQLQISYALYLPKIMKIG